MSTELARICDTPQHAHAAFCERRFASELLRRIRWWKWRLRHRGKGEEMSTELARICDTPQHAHAAFCERRFASELLRRIRWWKWRNAPRAR